VSPIQLPRRLLVAAACGLLVTMAHSAQVLPEPAVDAAAGGAGSVQPQPVQPRARTNRRLVYSCVEPGLIIYSDRPCSPAAARRELQVHTPRMTAGEAPDVDDARAQAADKRRTAAAKADANAVRTATERAETCARLEAAVDEVDSLMRAGYPAREAGRLWERWREARARLREARC
jgi:hypothetical protein